jgi:hypothetical protein
MPGRKGEAGESPALSRNCNERTTWVCVLSQVDRLNCTPKNTSWIGWERWNQEIVLSADPKVNAPICEIRALFLFGIVTIRVL